MYYLVAIWRADTDRENDSFAGPRIEDAKDHAYDQIAHLPVRATATVYRMPDRTPIAHVHTDQVRPNA